MEISCVAQCSNIDEEYLQNPEEQTEAVIIDVETQLYETKQVADAETQVETLSKSIGTQTLAIRKPKKVFYQLLHLSFSLVVNSKQMILIILLITITL